MQTQHFDVMIIGGGTAGLRTAIDAVHKKAKTVLIEPSTLGGTCLNVGCIPTKAMLYAAHLYHQSHEFAEFGIKTKASVDFKQLMQRVRDIVAEGQDHIHLGLKRLPLTVVRHKAQFVGKKTVVAGNQRYSANKIILSTGASNFIAPIPGLEKISYITNENILNIKKLPKSLVCLGGGYISMEFATFFAQLGTKVTILERMPTVLGMLDEDVRTVLLDHFDALGVKIITNANVLDVKQVQGVKKVQFNDVRDKHSRKRTISSDDILVAMGRKANTQGLGLEKAGVALSDHRSIEVDDTLQTTNPHIFAVGDCNGKSMFAHAAKKESEVALHNALYKKSSKMRFDMVPWAVFTQPPVAGIGLSEQEVQQKRIRYGIMKAPFSRTGRARIINQTHGFVKVLFNKSNRNVLGATIVGPNADDIIHEVVMHMQHRNAKVDTLAQTIHVHPTLSEVMVNLKEK